MKRFLATCLLLFASPLFAQEKSPPISQGSLGYKPLTPEKRKYYQEISHAKHGNRLAMMAANQALPAAFDVRAKLPIPIWDQGSCGSCYLVSTVRTMTSAYVAAGYGRPDNTFMLSNQYGMDRPRNFGGCDGGNGTEVVDWAIKNGWVAETYIDASGTHNDYPPYEARSGSDRTKAGAKRWMAGADWGFVNANGHPTVEEIKAALYNYGRLNIALDAGGQFGSGTGTITSLGGSINHEINVVGYDDAKGAFLLENQWGKDWGVDGCRWVTYGASKQIVDWFFVTVGQLPPPPVPPGPIPPGPTPPLGLGKVIIQIPGIPDTVKEFPYPITNVDPNMTLKQFADIISGRFVQTDEPPLVKGEKTPAPKATEDFETFRKEVQDSIKAIRQKQDDSDKVHLKTLDLIDDLKKYMDGLKKIDLPKPDTSLTPDEVRVIMASITDMGKEVGHIKSTMVKTQNRVADLSKPLIPPLPPNSARLLLTVPPGAVVFVNNHKSNSTNTVRHFDSTMMEPGHDYVIRVRVNSEVRDLHARVGLVTKADFTK